jgi:hypothetical protein
MKTQTTKTLSLLWTGMLCNHLPARVDVAVTGRGTGVGTVGTVGQPEKIPYGSVTIAVPKLIGMVQADEPAHGDHGTNYEARLNSLS